MEVMHEVQKRKNSQKVIHGRQIPLDKHEGCSAQYAGLRLC
jgi:hypothetical protein